MWVTETVNIPSEVLKAAKEGRLAVFAGAGVSMGEPSNYPNFVGFARELSEGAGEVYDKNSETVENFLGRLATRGTQVHALARTRFSQPQSRPTQLHRSLLSLFVHAEEVRIVTTNYDNHFSSAADEVYGQGRVGSHFAPALPLGRDFNGIVYLHGSVNRRESEMVITDRDFGRAYLLDGWASRFLHELFTSFLVVFIGYSHDDVVMHYLSRGLLGGGGRYAFCEPGKESSWSLRGITPIQFPLEDKGKDEYVHLGEGVAAWASMAGKDLFAHEARIRMLVDGMPPVASAERDYLRWIVSDAPTLRIFAAYASDACWLTWAAEEGLLSRVFSMTSELTKEDRVVLGWVVDKYLISHTEGVLAILANKQGLLCAEAWNAFANGITHGLERLISIYGPSSLSAWASVLATSFSPGCRIDLAEALLSRCQLPRDMNVCLVLLELITRPGVTLREGFGYPDFPRLAIRTSAFFACKELGVVWEQVFRPGIHYCAERLLEVISNQLRTGELLQRAGEDGPIGSLRVAIEPHDQDFGGEPLDVMINIARDCLDWLSFNCPRTAGHWFSRLADSHIPLLERLALHGLSHCPTRSADKKIRFALRRQLIHRPDLRYEVFELLRRTYPDASAKIREAILVAPVMAKERDNGEDDDEWRHDLFAWLHRADPSCAVVERALEELQDKHPYYYPSEHPHISVHIDRVRYEESPLSAQQLLELDPGRAVERLLDLVDSDLGTPFSHRALLSQLQEAVQGSFSWSLGFARHLVQASGGCKPIWDTILLGWRDANYSTMEWLDVLKFLENSASVHENRQLASLLEKMSSSPLEGNLGEQLLNAVEQLSLLVVSESLGSLDGSEQLDSSIGGWSQKAIKSTGGLAALSVLNCLYQKNKMGVIDRGGISETCRSTFDACIRSSQASAGAVRVVLAGHFHNLDDLDPEWARTSVFPMFDWSRNTAIARQAWDGYLAWWRPNERILVTMRPLYAETTIGLRTAMKGQEHYWRHVVHIATRSSTSPLEDEWLSRIILEATEEQRQLFARSMARQLQRLDPEEVGRTWIEWVQQYWANRITGKPVPLSSAEAGIMLDWVLMLGPVFPQAVELVARGPAPDTRRLGFALRLSKSNQPEQYPRETAVLLLRILQGMKDEQSVELGSVKSVAGRVSPYVAEHVVLRIREELLKQGCTQAF